MGPRVGTKVGHVYEDGPRNEGNAGSSLGTSLKQGSSQERPGNEPIQGNMSYFSTSRKRGTSGNGPGNEETDWGTARERRSTGNAQERRNEPGGECTLNRVQNGQKS